MNVEDGARGHAGSEADGAEAGVPTVRDIEPHGRGADSTETKPVPGGSEKPTVESLGLALSGGGVRAALFSLGVLLYLVRSGLNRKLVMVASVSGSSITNMALASVGDLSEMNSNEFAPICRRLASRLATCGSFFMPTARQWLLRGTASWLLIAVPVTLFGWIGGSGRDVLARIMLSGLLYVVVMGLVFFIQYFVQRGALQRIAYANIIRATKTTTVTGKLLPGNELLSKLPQSNVLHVVCATELSSGQPIFLSRDWIYSPTFGWGEPRVRQDAAVYASAAFPAVFPPLRVRTRKLEMSGGEGNRDRPRIMWLADGGVYNNLGNDWFDIAEQASTIPWGLDRRFKTPPKVNLQIVVNASSPSKRIHIPPYWPVRTFVAFARIMTVLYENTLRPRLELLSDRSKTSSIVLDIGMSPLELVEQGTEAVPSDAEVQRRGAELRARLNALSDDYLNELVEDSSLLKTTLSAIGSERAARLIRHGYISAMAALHVRFGTPGVDDVPDERNFIELTE